MPTVSTEPSVPIVTMITTVPLVTTVPAAPRVDIGCSGRGGRVGLL